MSSPKMPFEMTPVSWGLVLLAALIAGFIWVAVVERARLATDSQVITLRKRGQPDFRWRLLHISDLHRNGRSPFSRWRLRRYARRITALAYDVVVFTGDMVDDGAGIEPAVAFLAEVAGGRPVFAVLGNHDYHRYSSLENILKSTRCGISGWWWIFRRTITW